MKKLNISLHAMQPVISANFILDDSVRAILKPAPRLLVLISGDDMDNLALTQEVWQLAKPQNLEVVLLALCNSYGQEAQLRRQLVTMAAIIRDETIHVDFHIEYGKNWLKLIRQEWKPGDILACDSEQYIGLRGKPLSEILSANFKTQVQIFSISSSSRKPISKVMTNILFWFGALGILSAFFGVEAMIGQAGQDALHTFLLFICVLFEIELLWIWNLLF